MHGGRGWALGCSRDNSSFRESALPPACPSALVLPLRYGWGVVLNADHRLAAAAVPDGTRPPGPGGADPMLKWKGKPAFSPRQASLAKWALGCYTGAQLRPFSAAELAAAAAPTDVVTAAADAAAVLELLWKAGVIERAE